MLELRNWIKHDSHYLKLLLLHPLFVLRLIFYTISSIIEILFSWNVIAFQ